MRGEIFGKLLVVCVGISGSLVACGGGSDSPTVAPAVTNTTEGSAAATPPITQVAELASTTSTCSALPAMPVKPSTGTRNVRDFGARGDGVTDDTAAIQAAINSLTPGQWLVFPAGKYLHSKSLKVTIADVVLWSEGATLHATNPADQAVWLAADGASVYGFKLTAVTDRRRTAPWESRIAIFGGSNPRKLLSRNVIRGNQVVWAGAPGTALANSSSSAGIFVYNATRFLIAENTVMRSLADGIHITAASYNGRVIENTVQENGDDMIAMVSYINSATLSATEVTNVYEQRRAAELVHDILVTGNNLSGQYWGRGVSVVGGESITIENNTIDRTTHAAGVYLAREPGYLSFGVRNVIVRNNTITKVQTTDPVYFLPSITLSDTLHGGVEMYSQVFSDEASSTYLLDKLAVQQLRIENNVIDEVINNSIRIGIGYGKTGTINARRADGTSYTRTVVAGKTGLIDLTTNKMTNALRGGISIRNQPTVNYNVRCYGNTYNGSANTPSLCSGAAPVVTGAEVTCS